MSKESSRFKTLATLTVLSVGAMHLLNRSVALSSTAKNILRSDNGSFYHWKYGDGIRFPDGDGLLRHPVSASERVHAAVQNGVLPGPHLHTSAADG